jgi:uncharacterized protein (DUF849 family)
MRPAEIVADAIACADAGASIVHLHVRDAAGRPTHHRDLYTEAVLGIRAARPELVVCLTTSGRADPDVEARMIPLRLEGAAQPDMASCTLGSFNFPRSVSHNPPEVIERLLDGMRDRGIRPELEVFEPGMAYYANSLVERGLVEGPLYVNVLLGSLGAAPAFATDLARIVQLLPPGTNWAGAGIGVYQRPVAMLAVAMGGNVRTGLEDSPRPVDGAPASNVAAVRHAAECARLAGRDVASSAWVRDRLELRPAMRAVTAN